MLQIRPSSLEVVTDESVCSVSWMDFISRRLLLYLIACEAHAATLLFLEINFYPKSHVFRLVSQQATDERIVS